MLLLDVRLSQRNVSVRHRQGRVTEHPLEGERVSPTSQELDGMGMPEGVRGTPNCLDTGLLAQPLDELE